jgi:flavin reductase (DIM6/NTAB) family NADH-FMN oxidoreductase RutF
MRQRMSSVRWPASPPVLRWPGWFCVPDPIVNPHRARAVLSNPELRSALGRFATGVTIVSCRVAGGGPVGLTANSFSALSLQPPLILWSLRSVSPNLDAFRTATHFAVNVLAENQVELSRRFASPEADKFAEGLWSDGLGGAPVLAGCAAVFECEQMSFQAAGDHMLFIGQVLRVSDAPLMPLVFQSGHYRMLGEIL